MLFKWETENKKILFLLTSTIEGGFENKKYLILKSP